MIYTTFLPYIPNIVRILFLLGEECSFGNTTIVGYGLSTGDRSAPWVGESGTPYAFGLLESHNGPKHLEQIHQRWVEFVTRSLSKVEIVVRSVDEGWVDGQIKLGINN